MSATAVAQKPARATGAPARRPSRTAPRRQTRGSSLRLVRTAVAISDAADSPLLVRLTRSQAWIAIVGALLIGIVALNVYSLGMGSAVSATATQAAELERENSLLRERIGKLRKNGEIERSAARLGLGQPTSEELVRVVAGRGDAERAAARLTGELGPAAVAAAPTVSSEPVTDPTVTEVPAAEAAAVAAVDATGASAATTDPAAEPDASTAPPIDPTAAGGVTP